MKAPRPRGSRYCGVARRKRNVDESRSWKNTWELVRVSRSLRVRYVRFLYWHMSGPYTG